MDVTAINVAASPKVNITKECTMDIYEKLHAATGETASKAPQSKEIKLAKDIFKKNMEVLAQIEKLSKNLSRLTEINAHNEVYMSLAYIAGLPRGIIKLEKFNKPVLEKEEVDSRYKLLKEIEFELKELYGPKVIQILRNSY